MPSSNLQNISVAVMVKNGKKHLRDVLRALGPFGEVIVYDTGSKDSSLDIAQSFQNVKIVQASFVGFGPTRNMAAAAAKNDWILSIDFDEVVSQELIQAIINERLDSKAVYSFYNHNHFNEKWIKWCGWHPERRIRLYNRTMARYSDDQLHESLIFDGMRHVSFDAPVNHYPFTSISDFLAKMQLYSTLFAEQNCGKRSSSPLKASMHGIYAFLKSYLFKRGFMGGYEGFLISAYNAHTAFYKYLKLYEANKALEKISSSNSQDSYTARR